MMNKQIENWLNLSDAPLCRIKNGNRTYVFLRVQKDADFDYLYCQEHFGDRDLSHGSDFQYAGIYCKLDQLIYDAQYDLMSMEDMETLKERIAPVLSKQLEQAVSPMRAPCSMKLGNVHNHDRMICGKNTCDIHRQG